jgi:regulator of RNase E activity RraB
LAEHGDDGSISRRIDDWAYFDDAKSADAFASWAVKNGFFIEKTSAPDGETNDQYGLQLFHMATAELSEVTRTTSRLMKKAEELGGTYDGWETSVEKAESTGPSAAG